MFKDSQAFSGFSVDDLEKAKAFYEGTLGLKLSVQEGMGFTLELATGGKVFVYSKENHEPATFTILNFPVEDIDKAVDDLVALGIKFEHYEGDLQTDEKGILRSASPEDGPSIAWFTDPASNVLSVLQN